MKLRLLHLEDNDDDVELVRSTLAREGVDCDIRAVASGAAYLAALQQSHFDIVLSDSGVPGYDGEAALWAARERFPGIPFIVVSANADLAQRHVDTHGEAVTAHLPKSELRRLGHTIRHIVSQAAGSTEAHETSSARGMRQLVAILQRLSRARDVASIIEIVRHAARDLVHADGATVVLRDGDLSFYADEDAIGPLWKGQRFPLTTCIGGWTMLNSQLAAIEDIYLDARISQETYRHTFVKSLVMTPIRTAAPLGAIGAYWADRHRASSEEVELLKTLADSTSAAIEAADAFASLAGQVAKRTAEVDRRNTELEVLNKELEAFCNCVVHDLRSPLITIDGFTQVLLENTTDTLDETNRQHLERISTAARRMHRLINDLLGLSKIVRAPMHISAVDLSALTREILQALREGAPPRVAEFVVAGDIVVPGDADLLRIVLENLLSNAWKFTSRQERTRIEFGSSIDRSGRTAYFVRDNGAGFDPRYAAKLFGPFQRLHSQAQYPGTGIGLATLQRIIHRHGGAVWAESAVDCGACFYFTLPP